MVDGQRGRWWGCDGHRSRGWGCWDWDVDCCRAAFRVAFWETAAGACWDGAGSVLDSRLSVTSATCRNNKNIVC